MRESIFSFPYPLALLRIVVPLVIAASPELSFAPDIVASAQHFTFVPEGLGLLARVRIDPGTARVLQIVALSSAATATLGWASRSSMVVLTSLPVHVPVTFPFPFPFFFFSVF